MPQKYLGDLSKSDPLHGYLVHDILPQLSKDIHHPEFRVFRLHHHNHNNKVYLYEEKSSLIKVVGKFFLDGHERAEKEFHNLSFLRNSSIMEHNHQIIKPLGYNPFLDNLLVIEYASGDSLSKVILNAIHDHKHETLYHKLSSLAYFFSLLHNKTANGAQVDFSKDCAYFHRLVDQLIGNKGLSHHENNEFLHLCNLWHEKKFMWEDQQVIVHGDATPANFIFSHHSGMYAIDLERMKHSDRIFDIGRIVGELQHYFLNAGKHKEAAEPFISHFLYDYCQHFPKPSDAFRSITQRLPFQIAITLMRIARNSWISHEYSQKLIHEAKRTLRG